MSTIDTMRTLAAAKATPLTGCLLSFSLISLTSAPTEAAPRVQGAHKPIMR